jgi:hypothetical protein
MDYRELAGRVREKFPGSYDDMDDTSLAQKIVSKYPEYSDTTFEKTEEKSLPEFGANLAKDAIRVGEGMTAGANLIPRLLTDVPRAAAETASQMASGEPFSSTPAGSAFESAKRYAGRSGMDDLKATGEAISSLPGRAVDRAKEIVTDPAGSLYRAPITTAMDVALPLSLGAQGVGRGAQRIAPILERAVPEARRMVGKSLITGVNAALGPEDWAIKRRILRNPQVANAAAPDELASALAESGAKLEKKISEGSQKALGTLRTGTEDVIVQRYRQPNRILSVQPADNGSVPKRRITAMIERVKNRSFKPTSIGAADNAAREKLASYKQKLLDLEQDKLSERDIKTLIQSLDKDINWKDEAAKPMNRALSQIRVGVDTILKNQNPSYREAIAPVARQVRILKDVRRRFNLKRQGEGGYTPDTNTEATIRNAYKEGKSVQQNTLRQLANETGDDFLSKSEDWAAREEFMGGRPHGSRLTAGMAGSLGTLGFAAAGPAGAALGAATGTILGWIVDRKGKELAGRLIDSYLRTNPKATVFEFLKDTPEVSRLVERGRRPMLKSPEAVNQIEEIKVLDEASARKYLEAAGGDKALARELAKKDGFRIPSKAD